MPSRKADASRARPRVLPVAGRPCWPCSIVPTIACRTVTDTMPCQRRDQPSAAAVRTRGARWARRRTRWRKRFLLLLPASAPLHAHHDQPSRPMRELRVGRLPAAFRHLQHATVKGRPRTVVDIQSGSAATPSRRNQASTGSPCNHVQAAMIRSDGVVSEPLLRHDLASCAIRFPGHVEPCGLNMSC